MNHIYEYIKKYSAMLAAQEYPLGEAARLFVETAEGVFATKKDSDLAALSEGDIEKQEFNALPKGKQAIRSILISQTPYCTEWLKCGKPLVPALDDMAQIIGTRAVVIDARSGFNTVTPQLARKMKSNAGCFVITGQNADGAFEGFTLTVGRTPYEAIVAMTVLEKSAEVTLLAEKIGTPHTINALERKLMRTVYMKKYSKSEADAKEDEAAAVSCGSVSQCENSCKGSRSDSISAIESESTEKSGALSEDKEAMLRRLLVAYGNKLVACGLVQGTWGNLSARLDEKYMLTTPSGIDYARLTAEDMVKVNIETLEYEGSLKPTSEKGLHAAIYRSRPDIHGIIHTHSKYCSVYAAARKELSISDSGSDDAKATVFRNPVRLAAYALPGTKALMKNTAAAVGDNYGAIMSNHGMIVCGSTLETAFDNAQELEAIAKATLL